VRTRRECGASVTMRPIAPEHLRVSLRSSRLVDLKETVMRNSDRCARHNRCPGSDCGPDYACTLEVLR